MNAASSPSVSEAMVRARRALQSNDFETARRIAANARREHPEEASLADLAGDIALKAGDVPAAEAHFAKACALAQSVLDYALNHAIALQRLGRYEDVFAILLDREAEGRGNVRYANIRAATHRALRDLSGAARWYDAALLLDGRNPLALRGRSRVALERAEGSALGLFDRALAIAPGDASLWIGKANALDMAGDHEGALRVARQIVDQAPGLIDGLSLLANLRLARGEDDFASHYAEAAKKQPQNPNIPAAHCQVLESAQKPQQAAEIAAQARRAFPQIDHFGLLEALHRGSAGEWAAAEAIFGTLENRTAQRYLHEARHRLRAEDPAEADALLARVLEEQPGDVAAWALRGLAWRLLDDARAKWLHEQEGLVNLLPIKGADDLLERATRQLRELHENSPFPLGQSLRGGTQTRANLFAYESPVLQELSQAIMATLEDYRAGLPEIDTEHPLLRHREAIWRFDGSWSVRLTGGTDHHAAHIHPSGIISSALYLVLPEDAEEESGAAGGLLEVGRPPENLGLDLGPIRTIRPKKGHVALFPSTLYHGTTSFTGAERLTVAFDVVV